MAVFSLKDTINRTNNPSLDGIFEYGYYDPNTLAFTRFDTYGYIDGSPVDFNNLDPAKILGWYKAGVDYPHISFENIQGNLNITPQPFPTNGIYIHPAKTPFQSIDASVGVRINVPYNATFRFLTGSSVQGADTNCGDNINFHVKKGATDIIPNMILPHSSVATAFATPTSTINSGEVIDIIAGSGNTSDNPFCDDVSLEAIIEFIPVKIPTPILRGTLLCSSTTGVIYDIPLQTEGVLSLYRVGTVAPIATTNITQVGYSGTATFNGLDLTAGGEFYVIATNVGQADSDESLHITVTPCCVPPTIATQPSNVTVCSPNTGTLSVLANGTAPISYQWRFNGVDISGATNSSYTTSVSGNYDVIVTNACGTVTSTVATVTSNSSPVFTGNTTLDDAQTDVPYSFTLNLIGIEPFSLSNIVKPTWMTITVSGSTILLTGTPSAADFSTERNVRISFDVTNTCGTIPFSYDILVAQSCVPLPPDSGIIQSSANPAVSGQNITFVFSGILGSQPHTYTWSATNATIISGQGTNTCIISFSNNSVVTCVVTNCNGAGTTTKTYDQTIRSGNPIDDNVGTKPIGLEQLYDITVNDTLCNGGQSQFSLIAGSEINCTVQGIDALTGIAHYTPIMAGPFSFRYNLGCSGLNVGSATVSGVAFIPCESVTEINIVGNATPTIGATETYIGSANGTAPYVYNWTVDGGMIISGQGTNTLVVQWLP